MFNTKNPKGLCKNFVKFVGQDSKTAEFYKTHFELWNRDFRYKKITKEIETNCHKTREPRDDA